MEDIFKITRPLVHINNYSKSTYHAQSTFYDQITYHDQTTYHDQSTYHDQNTYHDQSTYHAIYFEYILNIFFYFFQ